MKFDLVTLKRGIRVFVFGFLGVYGAPALIGALSGSQPIDTSALRAAGVAGLVAVVAMLWNAFMDPSPVPSLKAERGAAA